MMSAILMNDPMPSVAGRLLGNDLMIHEFDYWTDPKDAVVAGTFTYCRVEGLEPSE